jgi:hypothetical protein
MNPHYKDSLNCINLTNNSTKYYLIFRRFQFSYEILIPDVNLLKNNGSLVRLGVAVGSFATHLHKFTSSLLRKCYISCVLLSKRRNREGAPCVFEFTPFLKLQPRQVQEFLLPPCPLQVLVLAHLQHRWYQQPRQG